MDLTEAVEVVRPADGEAETCEARPLLISGDPEQLRQAIWNLLSNAVKFSPAGGRVDVRVWTGEREAHVLVRAAGCGISADFLP